MFAINILSISDEIGDFVVILALICWREECFEKLDDGMNISNISNDDIYPESLF